VLLALQVSTPKKVPTVPFQVSVKLVMELSYNSRLTTYEARPFLTVLSVTITSFSLCCSSCPEFPMVCLVS